jgi:hypothetical protein
MASNHPRIWYLDHPPPVSEELSALAGPVKAPEVSWFAARCEEWACRHFDGSDRRATRIVNILPAVVESLPAFKIRRVPLVPSGRPVSLFPLSASDYRSLGGK